MFIPITDVVYTMMAERDFYRVWKRISKTGFGATFSLGVDLHISIKEIDEYIEIFRLAKLITVKSYEILGAEYSVCEDSVTLGKNILKLSAKFHEGDIR